MATESHSPETLAKAGAEVEQAYGQIEKQIQRQLYTQIETLMTTWQGPSAKVFYKGFQAFDAEFSKVQDSLNNLKMNLTQSGVSFSKAENEQSELAQSMAKLIDSK